MRSALLVCAIVLLLAGGCSAEPATSTPTPEQTLIPYPYIAYDHIPEPGAEDVPVTTAISITYNRPPGIVELQMEPTVEIRHVTQKIVNLWNGKFTFYLARLLQPETTYTVTITYGQEVVQPSYRSTATATWQFTTGPE